MEEVLQHPSYPDAIFDLKPTRSGLLPVANGRGGPFKIGWEVHGEGPIRMLVGRGEEGARGRGARGLGGRDFC